MRAFFHDFFYTTNCCCCLFDPRHKKKICNANLRSAKNLTKINKAITSQHQHNMWRIMNTFFSVSMVTNFGFVTLEAFKLISQSQRLLPILKPYLVHWKTHWGKNPNLIQKSTCSKSHHSRNSHFQNTFFTKFSLSNSHFSQISHLRSQFLTKNHIFKISFFTKITFQKPIFQKIAFSKSHFVTIITFQKNHIISSIKFKWIYGQRLWFCPSVAV